MSTYSLLGLASSPLLILATGTSALAQDCYSGICFPSGGTSFADTVIRHDPSFSGGCLPTFQPFLDPQSALGAPNYTTPANGNVISLGAGGLIELGFTDNSLVNSGTPVGDLHIFESGGVPEAVYVAVRPADPITLARVIAAGVLDANADGFFEIGRVAGFAQSIDLDAVMPGFAASELVFDAVQIVDDIANEPACTIYAGAEIDGVGASPIPEIGTAYCDPAVINSTGVPGRLSAAGSNQAADNALTLLISDLPPGQFGFCVVSRTQGFASPPMSAGNLCVAGNIGRLTNDIFQGPSAATQINLTNLPIFPGQAVMPGENLYFQCWHRDAGGTSNFTNAVCIAYQ